jgi:large repetitive protein
VVAGTDIVYTPPADASGPQHFNYSLTNAFGVSLPATITVTVNPLPVPVSLTAKAIAGTTVQVDLTGGAKGGPFTAANVVSVTPANAGKTTVVKTANGYQLDFTAATSFSGAADVAFTLSNAFATSASAHVTITVTARSDPSKNAEVLGVLSAQTESMRRFATAQISNFQQRLETMHGDGPGGGQLNNGISLTPTSRQNPDMRSMFANDGSLAGTDANRRYLVNPSADTPTTTGATVPGLPTSVAFWAGGAVDFGSRDGRPGGGSSSFDFNTSGLSLGADYRVSQSFAFGAGFGYGRDDSDIGNNGSRSKADSYNLAFYGSYHPTPATYLDGLIGYQWMSFDSRRFVTDDGNYVNGSRDGKQYFASLAGGYDYLTGRWHLSPYGRLDAASGTLDGYTETGDSTYALTYRDQDVKTTTASLGMRADYQYTVDNGTITPQFTVEYQHDLQGNTTATLSYADLLSGPLYRANVVGLSQNRLLLGIGASWQTLKGMTLRLQYQGLIGNSETDNSILLNIEKKF